MQEFTRMPLLLLLLLMLLMLLPGGQWASGTKASRSAYWGQTSIQTNVPSDQRGGAGETLLA